jgi:hypothetical protein
MPREGQGFRSGPWGRIAFGWERRSPARARSGAGQSWRGGWIGAGLALLLALLLLLPLGGATATAATSGTWTLTGSLHDARYSHTATLLQDGRVLVAGGQDANVVALASAELYDPQSGIWSLTGSLHQARDFHTATLLQDGRVLVAGGADVTKVRVTAELYTP